MDKLQTILTAVSAVMGFILTVAIPFAIKAFVAIKKGKANITQAAADKLAAEEAEKQAAAMLKMTEKAQQVVEALEKRFEAQNSALKSVDSSCTLGSIKQECALAELSEFAQSIGTKFDRDYWTKKITDIVQLTRNVNKNAV